MRDDLVEVFPNLPPDRVLRKAMLRHVRLDGGSDCGIVGERGAGETPFLQLVARQAGAKLVDGSQRAAAQPPPPDHTGSPPSFFNCA